MGKKVNAAKGAGLVALGTLTVAGAVTSGIAPVVIVAKGVAIGIAPGVTVAKASAIAVAKAVGGGYKVVKGVKYLRN
jgi:hypothetical protein